MAFARIQRMAIAERAPEAGPVSVPSSFWTARAVPVSGSIETTPCVPSRALSERTAVRWAAVRPVVAAVLREAARRAGTRESKYGLAGAAWRLSALALGLTADAAAGTASSVATVSRCGHERQRMQPAQLVVPPRNGIPVRPRGSGRA